MKTRTLFMLIVCFLAGVHLNAQTNNTYNMVIEMNNGTVLKIGPNDVKEITFNNGNLVITGEDIQSLIDENRALIDANNTTYLSKFKSLEEKLVELNSKIENFYLYDLSTIKSDIASIRKEMEFLKNADKTNELKKNILGSWTWNTQAPKGCVWGNIGYQAGSGESMALEGNGFWWGITSEAEFLANLEKQSDTGVATGEESMDAYMVFDESGRISSYSAGGNLIRNGSYELEAVSNSNNWEIAKLHTTAGSILFPFAINTNGKKPTDFEVVYLSESKLTLVYPSQVDGKNTGAWGEATFWQFKKND